MFYVIKYSYNSFTKSFPYSTDQFVFYQLGSAQKTNNALFFLNNERPRQKVI